MNNDKINSVYNDVNTAKCCVKWYLIIAGVAVGIVLFILANYFINVMFNW